MVMNNERRRPKPTSRRPNNASVETQSTFEPVAIEIRAMDTVVHLLSSKEDRVLLQVVAALDRVLQRSPENLHVLQDLNAMEPLLCLALNTDLNIKRFSLKLLAQLSRLENTQQRLVKDEGLLTTFVDILSKDEDVVAQEFASLILSELTANSWEACERVLHADVFDGLFLRISSADPDVQKNCAQLMVNLLLDPAAYEAFIGSQQFSFEPLLPLLKSEFPVIQHLVAAVIEYLTRQAKDNRTQALFRRAGGVDIVLDVMEAAKWKDLHQEVLRILVNSAQDSNTAEYIHRSGGLGRLLELMDKDNSTLEGILAVIAGIADTDSGRVALHENRVHERLVQLLRDQRKGVAAMACLGIALMTRHRASLAAIIALNPLKDVVAVLKSDSQSWEQRRFSAHALSELVRLDRHMALQVLENKTQDVIVNLLSQQIPVELSTKLIHCLTNLAVHEDIRSAMADNQMIQTLLSYLEEGDARSAELAVTSMECLSVLVNEAQVRESLLVHGSVLKIVHCLRHRSVPLAHAAASLLQLAVSADPRLATAFLRADALQWMMDRPGMRALVPVWATAIDSLLSNHLPAKMAYRHRLDMTDLTQEGFYVSRFPERKFLMLEELLATHANPIRTIYVCNFKYAVLPVLPEERTASKNAGRKTRHLNKKNANNNNQEEIKTPPEDHSVCLPDPYLPEYLQKLQKILTATKVPRLPSTKMIEEIIKTVAQFVADQMSGRDPNEECDTYQLELHLHQLKVYLKRNVIPLGYLRVGMYLERAVLFKILADRLGLPCALVRGQYGRAWVEVAVTEGEDIECEDGMPAIPLRLVRPNQIVDLIHNIGQLLVLDTYEADVYIGKPIH